MSLSNEFWLQIIIYAVSFGSLTGTILTRLKYIEAKQDKHNNLIERMTVVEQTQKSDHERLKEILNRGEDIAC